MEENNLKSATCLLLLLYLIRFLVVSGIGAVRNLGGRNFAVSRRLWSVIDNGIWSVIDNEGRGVVLILVSEVPGP